MVLTWNNSALRQRVRDAAMRGVVAAGEAVRTEAITLILETAKTGRIYQRRGIAHRASAPGEPPASDTGRLVNSIKVEYDFNSLSATVVATAAYGLFLEFGTQTIAPRPFLRPALANQRANVERLIKAEVVKVLPP